MPENYDKLITGNCKNLTKTHLFYWVFHDIHRQEEHNRVNWKNAVHFSGTKCCTYEETFNHHWTNHSISKANDCICRDSFVGLANMIEYFSQCLAFFASLPSIFVLPMLVTCHNSTECYFRKQDQIGHVIGRTSIYREIDGKSSSNRGESEWIAWEGRWCCEEQYLRCGWRQRHHRCTILSVSTPLWLSMMFAILPTISQNLLSFPTTALMWLST